MKTVLVTGGSRGLGLTFVRGLLDAGYRVSTCSRGPSVQLDAIKADAQYRDRLLWSPCSVNDPEEVTVYVNQTIQWAGAETVYGLINNAGVAMAGILASFPDIETEKIVGINLLGSIYMARAVSQHLLRSGKGGRIINVSSIIGSRGYNGLAAYSASKAGVDGLTRALARELGPRQITVNSVAPGYVRTEMSSTLTSEQLTQIIKRTPIGRLAQGSDIMSVVRFLLSEEASFVTGQTILVDGGISC